MIREVCLFDKFSFCKNGVKCTRVHLKEVCQIRECDYRKCDKRHPRSCRIFRMNGFCRFGTSCKYSHRLPKEVEEQNKKIETIEKVNAKLSKQVEDQNVEIKELKSRLIEIESRELKSLQKQINDLAKNNSEKETAIKNIKMKISNSIGRGEEVNNKIDQRKDNVTLEEVLVSEEMCEAEIIKADETQNAENSKETAKVSVQESEEKSLDLLKKYWKLISAFVAETEKTRKTSKEFKTKLKCFNSKIVTEKDKVTGELAKLQPMIRCHMALDDVRIFLEKEGQSCEKEDVLNLMKSVKNSLGVTIRMFFRDKIDISEYLY